MSYQPLDAAAPPGTNVKKWLDDHGFGVLHGPITPLIISIVSGLINGMLLFSFAAVFASLIFNTYFDRYTGIGLNMFTGSGLITGLIGIKYSQFLAGIIGPDINPVLLFVEMSTIINSEMNPDGDNELAAFVTMLCTLVLSTLILGVVFYTLGAFRLTRFVQFVPATVLNGFLGSIGYKVLKEAVATATTEAYFHHPFTWNFWRLLLPALPIGICLWLSRKKNIGNPAIVFPVFVLIPPAIFYAIALSNGYTIEHLREAGWFFESFPSENFWEQFHYLRLNLFNWSVFAQCVPNLLIMIVICTLDVSLKMAGTKRGVNIDVDFDHEMKLTGVLNLAAGATLCGPGYMQAKMALLNYGIIRNNTDRLPALICSLFNGALFFSGFPLLNYLPRFLLAGLLIFAGLPFISTNLVDSYKHMTKKEFFAAWGIVILTAIFGLLVGVVAGVGMAALIFAIQSGRRKCVSSVIFGSDYQSTVVRSVMQEVKLEHLGRSVAIIRLRHYVFFGSADQVFQLVRKLVADRLAVAETDRLRYLLVDFEQADGIDFSAAAVLLEIVRYLKAQHINTVVFTGMSNKIHQRLRREQVLNYITASYDTLDVGLEFVEDLLLEHSNKIRQRWFIFDALRKLHEQARLKDKFEALEQIFGVDNAAILRNFVTRVEVHRNQKIVEAGDRSYTLYLLQSGRMTSYIQDPSGQMTRVHSLRRGAFVNEDCLFASIPAEYTSIADLDCVLLALTQAQYSRLSAEHHAVALDIQRIILTRAAILRNKLQRELYATSTVQRESLRLARQAQMKSYRTQLRRSTCDASVIVDAQVHSLFAEFVEAQREIDAEAAEAKGSATLPTAAAAAVVPKAEQAAAAEVAAEVSESTEKAAVLETPLPLAPKEQRYFKKEAIIRVFGDMRVVLGPLEAAELVFDADTEDLGYITLESWYDAMTWIQDEEAEGDAARPEDNVLDPRLFALAPPAAESAAEAAPGTSLEEAEDEYERLLGRGTTDA